MHGRAFSDMSFHRWTAEIEERAGEKRLHESHPHHYDCYYCIAWVSLCFLAVPAATLPAWLPLSDPQLTPDSQKRALELEEKRA